MKYSNEHMTDGMSRDFISAGFVHSVAALALESVKQAWNRPPPFTVRMFTNSEL